MRNILTRLDGYKRLLLLVGLFIVVLSSPANAAFWNSSWEHYNEINISHDDGVIRLFEIVKLNVSTINCTDTTDKGDLRIIEDHNLVVPYQWETLNETVWFTANTSAAGNTSYAVYCNATGVADVNISFIYWHEDFETGVDGWANQSTARITADTASPYADSYAGNFTTGGSDGQESFYAIIDELPHSDIHYYNMWTRVLTTVANQNFYFSPCEPKAAACALHGIDIFINTEAGVCGAVACWAAHNNATIQASNATIIMPNMWYNLGIRYDNTTNLFNVTIDNFDTNLKNIPERGTPQILDTLAISYYSAPDAVERSSIDDIYFSTSELRQYLDKSTLALLRETEEVTGNVTFIENNTEFPADPTTYVPNATYMFNVTVCHNNGNDWIEEVNITWNGALSTITTNNTYNSTCLRFLENQTDLEANTHNYTWDARGNDSTTDWVSDTYTVQKSSGNNVTLTITPSTTVILGTEITATCSALYSSVDLKKDDIVVANPYSAVLPLGDAIFNCTTTETQNYSEVSVSTTVTVGIGGTGCYNNLTYAYKGRLDVDPVNLTAIDFQTYVDDNTVRADLKDVYVNATFWTNDSRWLIINTTGLNGTSLVVYFGNYLNNITRNTSAEVVSDFGTLQNVSQENNFVYLAFVSEMTLSQALAPNASHTLDFYCTGGHTSFDLTNGTTRTDFLVATFSQWNSSRVKVEYATGDYYRRHLIHDSAIEYRTMWIVDGKSYTVAQVVNELDDITGSFGQAQLTIRKWVGDALRTIDEQLFDASAMLYFYGVDGEQYQYYISNDVESRSLGYVIVDTADLSKTITLSGISFTASESLGNISYALNYSNVTGYITFTYSDPYDETNSINMTVYQIRENATLRGGGYESWAYFTEANTSTATFTYLVNNTTARYKVWLQLNHNVDIGVVDWMMIVGGLGAIGVAAIPALYLTLASLTAVFGVNLSVSSRYAPFGFVVSGILLFMFISIGWLSMPTVVAAFVLLLAVLMFFRRAAQSKE